MPSDNLRVIGAREHNLKNISVEIPRDKLVVLTGLSSSGKSSLAFDTIFRGRAAPLRGIAFPPTPGSSSGKWTNQTSTRSKGFPPPSPLTRRAPRTIPAPQSARSRKFMTTCASCSPGSASPTAVWPRGAAPVRSGNWETILGMPEGSRLLILAPVVRERKGTYQAVLEEISKSGFVRARVDGEVFFTRRQNPA